MFERLWKHGSMRPTLTVKELRGSGAPRSLQAAPCRSTPEETGTFPPRPLFRLAAVFLPVSGLCFHSPLRGTCVALAGPVGSLPQPSRERGKEAGSRDRATGHAGAPSELPWLLPPCFTPTPSESSTVVPLGPWNGAIRSPCSEMVVCTLSPSRPHHDPSDDYAKVKPRNIP